MSVWHFVRAIRAASYRAYRKIFCWWEICIICASETPQLVDCRFFLASSSLKKSELLTSIPLSSCQFEKICIRFSLRCLKKSESTLVGSCLLKGDTWPAETRILSRGRKREDPGNEIAVFSEKDLLWVIDIYRFFNYFYRFYRKVSLFR